MKFLGDGRPARSTLLDGDVVRKHLSIELGFSKEHRDINIRRIGWVACEITKNGGIAICAPIAPYDAIRKEVRAMVEPRGGFALVHAATPIEDLRAARSEGSLRESPSGPRAGLHRRFGSVHEPPSDAEIVIDTTEVPAAQAADQIIDYLRTQGYITLG